MTQHSSLKSAAAQARHRNVLKRHERIRALQETEKWEGRQSVYKLPKMKLLKIKVKKAKAKEAEQPSETQSQTQAQPQASHQTSAQKTQK